MSRTLIQIPKGQHVELFAAASVPQGDQVMIQNVDNEDVWVYEAATPASGQQGTLLRRGDEHRTSRGALGVYAYNNQGDATISAGPVSDYETVTVDNEPIALREGRQFRAVRKIVVPASTPLVWKFSALTDFQLIEQQLSSSIGDIELRAYRAADVTEATPFETPVPSFAKNTTNRRRLYDGAPYVQKNTISTGGSITVAAPEDYVDYDRGKTSNATAQQTSVNGSENSLRNLIGDTPSDYYLELRSLNGTSEGRFALAWTEFV